MSQDEKRDLLAVLSAEWEPHSPARAVSYSGHNPYSAPEPTHTDYLAGLDLVSRRLLVVETLRSLMRGRDPDARRGIVEWVLRAARSLVTAESEPTRPRRTPPRSPS